MLSLNWKGQHLWTATKMVQNLMSMHYSLQPKSHKEIIIHLTKLADTITVPMARASILWLIGEYSDRVPKIAPDVLRKMAKNFVNEVGIWSLPEDAWKWLCEKKITLSWDPKWSLWPQKLQILVEENYPSTKHVIPTHNTSSKWSFTFMFWRYIISWKRNIFSASWLNVHG